MHYYGWMSAEKAHTKNLKTRFVWETKRTKQWSSVFHSPYCFFFNIKLLLTILYFKNHWNVINLQCCVSLSLQQSESVKHIHISTLFKFIFRYVTLQSKYWVELYVVYERSLLFICFIYSMVHMLIKIFLTLNALLIISLLFTIVTLFLLHQKFICILVLDCTHKWYHMAIVFLSLIYFTQYDNL